MTTAAPVSTANLWADLRFQWECLVLESQTESRPEVYRMRLAELARLATELQERIV